MEQKWVSADYGLDSKLIQPYANAKREVESMEYETTKANVFWNLSLYYSRTSEKFRRGHSMLWAGGKAWSQCFVSLVHVENVRKSIQIDRKEALRHCGLKHEENRNAKWID